MVPKKIQAALEALGIRNVVDGYVARSEKSGVIAATFTGWDSSGNVVVLLQKPRKGQWKLIPRDSFKLRKHDESQ